MFVRSFIRSHRSLTKSASCRRHCQGPHETTPPSSQEEQIPPRADDLLVWRRRRALLIDVRDPLADAADDVDAASGHRRHGGWAIGRASVESDYSHIGATKAGKSNRPTARALRRVAASAALRLLGAPLHVAVDSA